ncbi:hypothetical protein ACJMK2_044145 [Sinanodonta woodiana]|uniref:AP-5 complex subunit beta-1 n=1 Tax=Sinanodonta woodiana TaxID=1069815 RepID=A0ABD3VZZ4_SINWO
MREKGVNQLSNKWMTDGLRLASSTVLPSFILSLHYQMGIIRRQVSEVKRKCQKSSASVRSQVQVSEVNRKCQKSSAVRSQAQVSEVKRKCQKSSASCSDGNHCPLPLLMSSLLTSRHPLVCSLLVIYCWLRHRMTPHYFLVCGGGSKSLAADLVNPLESYIRGVLDQGICICLVWYSRSPNKMFLGRSQSQDQQQSSAFELWDSILNGTILKRFQDSYFVFDALKILYEDDVDRTYKIELLIVLEEYGHHGIDSESVDQVITSLLDIFHQLRWAEENQPVCCQAIITAISLLLQMDQLNTEVGKIVVSDLVTIAAMYTSQPETKRLQACACQCLIQIEDFSPGFLFSQKEAFLKLVQQERSDIIQDCVLLLSKVMENYVILINTNTAPTELVSGKQIMQQVLHNFTVDPMELRQIVFSVMEMIPLLTPFAVYRVTQSLSRLVQHVPEISPTIFKPMILQHMATIDCTMLHRILQIQREFEGEVLTSSEESQLLDHFTIFVNHPCIVPAIRLLGLQWMQHYKQSTATSSSLPNRIKERHSMKFFPSVFDPVECHVMKVKMNSLLYESKDMDAGVESAVLIGSLGYLHKLVWHTGRGKTAIALFRALFRIYERHHSSFISKDIQRLIQELISEFPQFIPHALDFIECLRSNTPDSSVYVEILSRFHQQIMIATEEQIAFCYDFYLQALNRAASEKAISPVPTLKFLHYLCEHASSIADSSWQLGHAVLSVCRNLLICHGTNFLYTEMGDLLYFIMTTYHDVDVQDKAKFYYALLTGASDHKIKSILADTTYGAHTMHQAISTILMADTKQECLAQIRRLDSCMFTWKRSALSSMILPPAGKQRNTTVEKDFNKQGDIQSEEDDINKGDASSDGEKGSIESYLKHLEELETKIEAKLAIKLKPDTDFKKVYAVSIRITVGLDFKSVKDINLPCLDQSEDVNIVVDLIPINPVPATFACSATFCCDRKLTFSCDLPPFNISLPEFFLPLPWNHGKALSKMDFFNSLWNWIVTDAGHGIESVKILPITQTQFNQAAKMKLQQYQINKETGIDLQGTMYGIFLPPKYHLLLKCRLNDMNEIAVSIATDFSTILLHVDKFLESIVTCTSDPGNKT